jgi:glycosyltransferase involved in cell wall biosynthesis
VVHNGVDTGRFRPERPPGSGARVRLVAVGRLDPRKGLDLALEAIAAVAGAELAIVGEGEARAALGAHVRRLGIEDRVTFLGFRPDVRDAIADADLALSSAAEEGLGIALLEAMAMERAVVAVPVGGIVEIVTAGETGWLAAARTAPALARAIEDAAGSADERSRRGKAARAAVVERFSLDAMRAGYERIYARLAG